MTMTNPEDGARGPERDGGEESSGSRPGARDRDSPSGRGSRRLPLALRWAGGLLALAGMGSAGAFLLLSRPFPAPPWREAPPHPPEIYQDGESPPWDDPSAPLVSPFHLAVDPMEALLLVNIEGDPDSIYLGFEPQAFDDPVHGRGLLVIGWRVDGRVDVYHEPGLRLDPGVYGITGEGLHRMVERDLSGSRLAVTPGGVEAHFDFPDLEGRPVRFRVEESARDPRHPFGLLAPMGAAASHPPALPLVFLRNFDFVRRGASVVRVEVDGTVHAPDRLPLPVDGLRRYFLRYSPDPLIVRWNPGGRTSLSPLVLEGPEASSRGVRYQLRDNHGHPEIHRMRRREGDNEVVVEFEPALPRLFSLREGVSVSGAFRISSHSSLGVVTGHWEARRREGRVHLEVVPDGGWAPSESKRSVRLMYRLVPTFREWPTTYRWTGTLALEPGEAGRAGEPGEGLAPVLEGRWERIP